jgi:hypothetical protein
VRPSQEAFRTEGRLRRRALSRSLGPFATRSLGFCAAVFVLGLLYKPVLLTFAPEFVGEVPFAWAGPYRPFLLQGAGILCVQGGLLGSLVWVSSQHPPLRTRLAEWLWVLLFGVVAPVLGVLLFAKALQLPLTVTQPGPIPTLVVPFTWACVASSAGAAALLVAGTRAEACSRRG